MSRASAGSVVSFVFRSILRRRNLRRMRRLGAAFMAVLTAMGVGLQQTQADFFIMHRIVHGPMPTRQYIPVDGEWTDYAAEWGKRFVKSITNWADRRFSSSSPPDPAAVTGAPWP